MVRVCCSRAAVRRRPVCGHRMLVGLPRCRFDSRRRRWIRSSADSGLIDSADAGLEPSPVRRYSRRPGQLRCVRGQVRVPGCGCHVRDGQVRPRALYSRPLRPGQRSRKRLRGGLRGHEVHYQQRAAHAGSPSASRDRTGSECRGEHLSHLGRWCALPFLCHHGRSDTLALPGRSVLWRHRCDDRCPFAEPGRLWRGLPLSASLIRGFT